MRRAALIAGLLVAAGGVLLAAAHAARPLVADLSSKQIRISTAFTGAELLLFGATEAAGDIAVVVRGPLRGDVVRRKERMAGIWINGQAVHFEDVPGYYFVASTRPLEAMASEAVLNEHAIGVGRLRLPAVSDVPRAVAREFRTALIRLKRRANLYGAAPHGVTILDNRLFRADITFPATVPTGTYSAEVYLFRDGVLAGSSLTPITVRKVGLEAAIFEFAHEHAAIYGIMAIVMALLAGWLAGAVFRKT